VNLGTLDATGSGGVSNITTLADGSVITTTATGQVTTQSHFADNIFRVGLNYQFH
jgi:outer membrane immunogenic protein